METFFQRIFSVPDSYSGLRKETARTVKKLLILLPIPFTLLITERLIRDDTQGAIFILLALVISFTSFILLNRNLLTGAVIFLCSIITILVTVNVTFVHGIHSVAVIAFPVIIVFSSLIIKRSYLAIFSFVSLLAIFWLGGGQELGYFDPLPFSYGRPSDLLTALTILTVGLFVTNDLARNLKNASIQADNELTKTEEANQELQLTINQKNELIHEVHTQARTNLGFIHQLLERQNSLEFRTLTNRIQAIYFAHDLPILSENLKLIDFGKYIQKYFAYLSTSLSLKDDQLSSKIQNIHIPLDQVNSLGICFHELIGFSIANSPEGRIMFESALSKSLNFKVSSNNLTGTEESSILFDITVRQLGATFTTSEDGRIGELLLPQKLELG